MRNKYSKFFSQTTTMKILTLHHISSKKKLYKSLWQSYVTWHQTYYVLIKKHKFLICQKTHLFIRQTLLSALQCALLWMYQCNKELYLFTFIQIYIFLVCWNVSSSFFYCTSICPYCSKWIYMKRMRLNLYWKEEMNIYKDKTVYYNSNYLLLIFVLFSHYDDM